MIPSLRQRYNAAFTDARYAAFTADLDRAAYWPVDFRVAETPLFLDEHATRELVHAADDITRQLAQPEFRIHAANAIPAGLAVPAETEWPHFLAVDFALCHDEQGRVTPRLIELQGFPTVASWQVLLANSYRGHFPEVPPELTTYFGGLDEAAYLEHLRKAVIGGCDPENVVLLEIEPDRQKTRVDFAATHRLLGVRPVCLSTVRRRGRQLFYSAEGREVPIHRIFNRVIFDELLRKPDFKPGFNFTDEIDVQWAGHPNWYFRISKHAMPFLKSPFVPDCHFVNQLKTVPADLEHYVLKPLYSFAGLGVDIAPTKEKIAALPNPGEWILQRKVAYAPLLATPDGPAKAEIRLIFVGDGSGMPKLVNNLVRLTKGAMHGVDYNKGKTWVGASCAFHPAV
ncbi:MAG: hypothetical protein Q8J74_09225 [Candidatus Didemnitutus sp.]|nr:hypothetical protein [Candidatus Didemnitutus sp.]